MSDEQMFIFFRPAQRERRRFIVGNPHFDHLFQKGEKSTEEPNSTCSNECLSRKSEERSRNATQQTTVVCGALGHGANPQWEYHRPMGEVSKDRSSARPVVAGQQQIQ